MRDESARMKWNAHEQQSLSTHIHTNTKLEDSDITRSSHWTVEDGQRQWEINMRKSFNAQGFHAHGAFVALPESSRFSAAAAFAAGAGAGAGGVSGGSVPFARRVPNSVRYLHRSDIYKSDSLGEKKA